MKKTILLTNIKKLYGYYDHTPAIKKGVLMNDVSVMENAWLLIENGIIISAGTMPADNQSIQNADEIVDCSGRMVFPGFCDSHTHSVFAEWRQSEFIMKLKGKSYEEIARNGGGILNSAKKLQRASEDDLFEMARQNLYRMAMSGTTSFEIKTGYGLTPDAELKMIRVINRLKNETPFHIKSTLLAAHAVPEEYKHCPDDYVDVIINEILPAAAENHKVDFIDVFCEKGFFSPDQTDKILEAANSWNLPAKIHVNQFHSTGGINVAVKHNALSVDHLEVMTPEDIEVLSQSKTIATVLPLCSLFLKIPFSPVKQLIEKDIPLAIATDFNPGSAPSGNMLLAFSIACIYYDILPEVVLNATTINGSYAMQSHALTGCFSPGKRADLWISTPLNDLADLAYKMGHPLVWKVMAGGLWIR